MLDELLWPTTHNAVTHQDKTMTKVPRDTLYAETDIELAVRAGLGSASNNLIASSHWSGNSAVVMLPGKRMEYYWKFELKGWMVQ